MCWVQRKPFGVPGSDEEKQILQAKVSRLEDYVDTKQDELMELAAEMAKVEAALRSRLAIIDDMADNELFDKKDRDPETAKYLQFRPSQKQFQQTIEASEDKRMDTLIKQGVKLKMYMGSPSGAFGRKKKPKKTDVFMKLSKNEDELTWGPKGTKKGQYTFPVEELTVKYGKKSELFMGGLKETPWDCFTITANGEEFNFVSNQIKTVMTVVTVVDTLGGADDALPQMTRGRFLWHRAGMRADYNANRFMHLIDAGVYSDGEEEDEE